MRKEFLHVLKGLSFCAAAFLTVSAAQAQCTTAPSGLGFSATGPTTATISWTTGGATNWNVEYGPAGFTLGNGTQVNATTTSLNLTGLTSNLAYQFYVRDSCSASSVSSWTGPQAFNSQVTPCDDFDIYNTGLIDPQSTLINGWASAGGDGTVSSDYANSSPYSLKIYTSGSNGYCDMVTSMPTYTSGIHNVKFDFYLPTGYGGYYNILHNYVGASSNVWAIEVYLSSNGTASVEEGTNGSGIVGTYSFNVGSWNTIEHIIDLDNDTAFIKVNGDYTEVGWQFSLGSTNYGDQFNAVNFYSTAPTSQTPLTYYDNFCVTDAEVDDVEMVEFIPVSPLCGDTNFPIEAVVGNSAENSQSGFDIEVQVSGSLNTTFTYTYPGYIQPGELDTVVLGYINTLSGGTYNIITSSQLSGDTDTGNDTITEVNMAVFASPVVNLGSDTFYCSNDGFNQLLSAGNVGSTYEWSTGVGAQSINVDTAGTYWVEVTDINSCVTSDTIVVVEYTAPDADLGDDVEFCDNVGISLLLDAGNPGSIYFWSTGASTQTTTVNAAGTYTVVVVSLEGCGDLDSMNVVELEAPVITLDDEEICGGDTITLDAGNPGSTYEWSVTGETSQTLDVYQAGAYQVTVTAANSCVDSGGMVLTVNVVPFVFLGDDTTIFEDSTLTLDAGNAGSDFEWSTGAITQTINVTESGTYTVTVTNSFGCESVDEIEVTVIVGIPTIASAGIRFYPNPVSQNATLELNIKTGGELSVELYNMGGQLVSRTRQGVQGGMQNIPFATDGLGTGLYMMRVILDGSEVATFSISKL